MRVLLKCAAAIWLFATPANADFKDVVAARFSSRAENVIVNVPPRPGAWPGAVLTYNMRFPAKSGDPGDPALRRGDKTSIPAEDGFRLDAKSKASVWSFFRLSPAAGDSAEIVMSFTDAQAIDMNAQDLVRRVEAAEAAAAAARRGQIPLVIRRAYVGTPIITISRKADASAEAWTKVKAGLEAAARSAAAPAGDVITYAAGEPFAFAFEADEISFDPGELAKGSIKVSFAPLPGQLFAIREQESDRALAAAEIGNIGDNGSVGSRNRAKMDFCRSGQTRAAGPCGESCNRSGARRCGSSSRSSTRASARPRRNCSRATAKTGSIIGGNARARRRGAAADCAPSAAAQRESTQSETEKAPPGTLIPRTA